MTSTTPSQEPRDPSTPLRWLGLALAVALGGMLAWALTTKPPAPSTTQVQAQAQGTPEPVPPAPAQLATSPTSGQRHSAATCAAPRTFEAAAKPYLVVEESQGEQRWYLRCPRLMRQDDGSMEALVRYQDQQGLTGLGLQHLDPAGGLGGLEPVLTLANLAAVQAEVVGCAALSPEDDGRAWVSVQREDRSRVIHALRWQNGQLRLDGAEPVLSATQDWMKDRLWEPAVVRHGGEWLMYMRCGSRTRGDLCLASSPDGQRWTMEPTRVLSGIEAGKNEVYGAPWAVSDGERLHLWFAHKRYQTDDDGEVTDVRSEIHHLSTKDPRAIELRFESVALAPGFADWAQAMVDTPTVGTVEGRTAMLYRGGNSAKDGVIGVAWGDCGSREHGSPTITTKSLKSTRGQGKSTRD